VSTTRRARPTTCSSGCSGESRASTARRSPSPLLGVHHAEIGSEVTGPGKSDEGKAKAAAAAAKAKAVERKAAGRQGKSAR
jgi:hypothetical protein